MCAVMASGCTRGALEHSAIVPLLPYRLDGLNGTPSSPQSTHVARAVLPRPAAALRSIICHVSCHSGCAYAYDGRQHRHR